MQQLPWRKKNREMPLSAYVDGELNNRQLMEIGEDLVLNPKAREALDSLSDVKFLVEDTLAPIQIPNSKEVAANIWKCLQAPNKTIQSLKLYNRNRRRNSAAMIASIGLLVTAGITFARFRKRRLI